MQEGSRDPEKPRWRRRREERRWRTKRTIDTILDARCEFSQAGAGTRAGEPSKRLRRLDVYLLSANLEDEPVFIGRRIRFIASVRIDNARKEISLLTLTSRWHNVRHSDSSDF